MPVWERINNEVLRQFLAPVFWYLASKSMWCESRHLINSLCTTPLFLQTHLFKIWLLHFLTKSVHDGKEGNLKNKKQSSSLHLSWPYLFCMFVPFVLCSWQGVCSLDILFCLVMSEICAVKQHNSESRQIKDSETVSSMSGWDNRTLSSPTVEKGKFSIRFCSYPSKCTGKYTTSWKTVISIPCSFWDRIIYL